ncbi:hypothetical protein [Rhizobium sp. BK602]|uniref:hypothetical protein n=1 Tax=Rhizobium sp. BK602 TaxID=2586986 RepID=UPI00161BF658|nr:hypothetical protein [Rhizobium sp. BK602]MBB3610957.1 hypothetical protein [Rhizobium sp. BK602]
MPNTTVPATGGAMPNPQGPKLDESRDPTLLVLDAQNLLSEIKHLNEAIFLAAHGLGVRHHMNAITTVADIIEDKLLKVEEILDAARAAREVSL